MGLFSRRYDTSLPQTVAWPAACLRVRLMWVDHRLAAWGPQLLRMTHLRTLHIQGDGRLWESTGFTLPSEIRQLRMLRRLTLLNLPIGFPEWIADLPNLSYLVVRGTDLTQIPPWIHQLRQLRVLRVENCALQPAQNPAPDEQLAGAWAQRYPID